jgi:hypothetical protein
MFKAPIIRVGRSVVTIVLTDPPAHRHTVLVPQQTIKITEEGAWLRN